MLKAQFLYFLTKRRFVKSYKMKKFILAVFLIVVDIYVVFNLSSEVKNTEVYINYRSIAENLPQSKPDALKSIVVKEKELTIEEKIQKKFPECPEVMIAIAKAESNLDPKAININTNKSIDIGLFQINSVHDKEQLKLFDVDTNIEVAREIYEKQGLQAWASFNNKSFMKFL